MIASPKDLRLLNQFLMEQYKKKNCEASVQDGNF